jgi:flagellar biosynthesis protein FlhG
MIDDEPSKNRRRIGRAPVFAVTSGKAGVGKTHVVANLAVALRGRHKRVMAIDAALGTASLDRFFDVKPIYSLGDFFAGKASLEEIIVANADGILLLPGPSGADEIIGLSDAQKLTFLAELDGLTHELDFVLVDTGSGAGDAVTYFASAAQEIVVVVTPEPASLSEGYALIETLACQRREKRFRILANRVTGDAEARRLFDSLSARALRFLNASLDLFGWIPEDAQLPLSAARRQTLIAGAEPSPAAEAMQTLAERLIAAAAGSKVKGNMQFFLRRMLEDARADV